MGDTQGEEKKPIENGVNNESEDSGNTSEQEPCLPETKEKEMDISDTLESKHLDTEISRHSKKRHNVNKTPHISAWRSISDWFVSTIKYLREKTGLSNLGLAVAAIILLLLLVCSVTLVVMGILWPKIPHNLQFPICRRSACLRSSSEILPRMDTNVSACDNFQGFSCGQWLRSNPLPPSRSLWSLQQELQYNTRDRLRQLIVTQPHPISGTLAWKTKYLYDSCMALDNIEMSKEIILTNHINLLGGWGVLREFQLHSFDFRETFTQLHSQFGVSVFFKVDVVPDPRSAQDHIIQIMPADFGLPDKSYYYRPQESKPVVTYKRYLQDVTQLLGATTSDASQFSEDIFYYEKRVAEVTPDTRDLHPLQAAHKITVGELKNIAPSVPVHDVLLKKYPEANIDDHTAILVPFPDHLRNISNLISNTDRTGLNNYMMWRLVDSFLPYMSHKFTDTIAVYRRDLFGEKEPLQRWEMCVQTMQQFMGFGLAVMLQNSAQHFYKDKAVVEGMFNDLKRQAKKAVSKATWLPVELQEHINSKLKTISVEVGFPTGGDLLSDLSLKDMYHQLSVINRDFFQNIKYGITFHQFQQQLRLKKFDEIYRWMDAASNFDLKVRYVAAANKVIVPQALLQEPFFHPDYPTSVLFGGLGVEVASAILQAISPWDVLYADDGVLVDDTHPAVKQSRLAALHPMTCLRQWWGREGLASPLASNQTVYNTLVRLSGVNIAYKSLKAQLRHTDHIHQPALEMFEDEHLFFITFAQSVCSVRTPQQKDVDDTLDIALDDKSLLSVIVSQVKEFSSLFSCSAANVLYTETPCEEVF